MDATKFDQLPDLCLRKVFAFLGLRDLVKCRAVNRQFKFYADRTKVTELVVGKRYPGQSGIWYQTGKPIDSKNSISPKAFASAKSSPFKLDQQLKYLCICAESSAAFKFLNELKQLIHLEVAGYTGNPVSLILSNLKVLVVDSQISFALKTPKLEVLQFSSVSSVNKLRFEYPETIKWIECNSYNGGEDFRHLIKFRNLEVLEAFLEAGDALAGFRLSDLPALKELRLRFGAWNLYLDGDEEFKSSVLDILRQRSALQRDELVLSLNEVLMDDVKQLPIFEDLFDPSIDEEDPDDSALEAATNAFKFMNYRQLLRDSYRWITAVNFNLLMGLDFEISEDFFVRFPRIQELTATDLVVREQFEWFLQNAKALRVLKLFETRLDQAFADHLPKLCSRLTDLKLYESSGLVFNFNFLLQFEQLKSFDTDLSLHSFDLAAAFRQSTKLKSLRFRTGNAFMEIERSSAPKDRYSVRFFRAVRDDEETTKTFETFCQKGLTWAQLAALYDSRRTGFIVAPEKRKMRIKPARL